MAIGGLVEVCVNWPGHPRYLKKKLRTIFFFLPITSNLNFLLSIYYDVWLCSHTIVD